MLLYSGDGPQRNLGEEGCSQIATARLLHCRALSSQSRGGGPTVPNHVTSRITRQQAAHCGIHDVTCLRTEGPWGAGRATEATARKDSGSEGTFTPWAIDATI